MSKSYILKNVRVVDPNRNIDEVMDLGIENGVMADPATLKDAEVIDLTGKIAAPGFMDIHVHLRQPGNTAAETIQTGTEAAAYGGFTAIVPMPNTSPAADTPGAIELLKKTAAECSPVKVYPCGCMTKGYAGQEMAGIGGLHSAGVYALSDDGKCVQNHFLMRNIVRYAKSFNLPILDHCEEETLFTGGVMNEGKWSVLLGMDGIPSAAEEIIVARDIIFAREIDWKIHLQHISVKSCVEMIRRARKQGIKITAEATPHHISLTDENIKTYNTNYKMNPPLRTEEDRQALLEGLADGTITVIATDHAPHTTTAKLVEFNHAPFGIIGLETAISVCLKELVHSGLLSMKDFVAKFTTGPAEVLGFENYDLRIGNPADITVIDLEKKIKVDVTKFHSKSSNSPYDGMEFVGGPVMTIVDGKIVASFLSQ
ncbi:MAG: dihydroorotase [Lentisphaeria bacterium]|nr:dihydroorotase [Lentisphaeria bacterium]